MVFLFGKLAAAAAATLMIPAVLSKPVTPASVPLHPKLLNPSVDHEVPNSFIVGYHSNVSVATMQSHMASITTQLFKRSSDVIGAGIGSVYHIGSMKAFQVTADMGTINAIADAPEVGFSHINTDGIASENRSDWCFKGGIRRKGLYDSVGVAYSRARACAVGLDSYLP